MKSEQRSEGIEEYFKIELEPGYWDAALFFPFHPSLNSHKVARLKHKAAVVFYLKSQGAEVRDVYMAQNLPSVGKNYRDGRSQSKYQLSAKPWRIQGFQLNARAYIFEGLSGDFGYCLC